MQFYGKVVIITGASSGIGASAAVLFAKQSAKVVLVGRNEKNLRAVAVECESLKNIKPLVIRAELENAADIKSIVTKTLDRFGKIDVLVNNAGGGTRGCMLDGVGPYDKTMAINIRAPYLLTSLAAPHIISSKGNIVNVSSVAAFKPIRDGDYLPYCISKAALDQFTKCVALEFAQYGVRVNSVNPGGTKTPLTANAEFTKDDVERLFKVRGRLYPLGKMAESEEVADLIVYLASDRARSITGGIYVVDNGETLL